MSSAMEEVRRWTTYREEDGLYHNMVTAVVQTRDGAMWFATFGGGISRYDGHAWRTFTTVDGLPGNAIVSLFEAADGTLWASSAGGFRDDARRRIVRLVDNRWEAIDLPEDEMSVGLTAVRWALEVGSLSATIDRGILDFDDGDWHALTTEGGLASNNIRCMLRTRDGALWVAYDYQRRIGFGRGLGYGMGRLRSGQRTEGEPALSRMDPRTDRWSPVSGVSGLDGGIVLSMAETEDGVLWFGTADNGLLRHDGHTWRQYTEADGLPSNRIQAVVGAPDGSVWLGTQAGAAHLIRTGIAGDEEASWEVFTEREGLPNNAVTSVCVTRNGSVWIGTRGGVARYGVTGWVHHSLWSDVAGRGGTKLARDSKGSLWAATRSGLHRLEGMEWKMSHRFASSDVGRTADLVLARDGVLWMATSWEVLRYDGENWLDMEVSSHGLNGPILSIFPGDRTVWAGTRQGAYRFDGTSWAPYALDASGPVTAVLETRGGDRWFGLVDGAIHESGGQGRLHTEADGLPGGPVIELVESRDGSIWVSSLYGGVARYDGEGWASVPPEFGTTFNEVRRIYEANDGTFWLASTADGAIHTDGSAWTRYTVRSGLPGSRVWDVCQDAQGQLWFATNGGLGCYGLDKEAPETFLFGAPERVAPYQPVLLRFSAQDAWKRTPAEAFLYSWRLDGGPWSPFSHQDQVLVSDLEPGTHSVEVRSMDREFNADPTPAAQTFGVLAPVWRQSWFIAVSLISLAALVASTGYGLQRNRRWRETRSRLIDELESELTMAHDMQMGLLPGEELRTGQFEIAGRCKPANHVGGDYYNYFWLDDEQTVLGFGNADVSGKAMVAAVRVMQLSGIFFYEFRGERPLGAVLEGLHDQLRRHLDMASFVTCCLGALDVGTGSVRLGNAGHSFPLHYSKATGKVTALDMPSLPLGLSLPPDTPGGFAETELPMAPGDVLVLYSDGVTDLQDADGDFYEEWRLRERILRHADEGAEVLLDAVMEDLERFRGTTPQVDDVTLLVLRLMPG